MSCNDDRMKYMMQPYVNLTISEFLYALGWPGKVLEGAKQPG